MPPAAEELRARDSIVIAPPCDAPSPPPRTLPPCRLEGADLAPSPRRLGSAGCEEDRPMNEEAWAEEAPASPSPQACCLPPTCGIPPVLAVLLAPATLPSPTACVSLKASLPSARAIDRASSAVDLNSSCGGGGGGSSGSTRPCLSAARAAMAARCDWDGFWVPPPEEEAPLPLPPVAAPLPMDPPMGPSASVSRPRSRLLYDKTGRVGALVTPPGVARLPAPAAALPYACTLSPSETRDGWPSPCPCRCPCPSALPGARMGPSGEGCPLPRDRREEVSAAVDAAEAEEGGGP